MITTVLTTDQEKFEMYNKLSKKELIQMLIQANKYLDNWLTPKIAEKSFVTTTTDYYKKCSCHPLNGGSGLCGCTLNRKYEIQ